jgi:glycosyltransferase involved in cell wall biosynthesis
MRRKEQAVSGRGLARMSRRSGILHRMSGDRPLRTAPLRILFVSPGVLEGAHLVFVRREAEALRAAGHEVDVFGFDNDSYLPWRLAAQVLKLRHAIRRARPDVVHAQFGKFNALVAALSLLTLTVKVDREIHPKPPLVITFRGTDINHNTRYSWLRSALGLAASQLAAFAARGLVCVSKEIRSKVWAGGTRPSIVVPTGVDLGTFVPLDRKAARERLGLGADEKIILFNAGKNPAVKDPELAAAAVAEAEKHVGGVKFIVVEGNVKPEDMPLYMNAADCLLVTSHTEGSPTVVQEAMACNLPVVSVDVGDVRERLAGVKYCAVLPRRDPAALGLAVATLLREPRRSDGRAHAAALSVEAIAARLTDFYGTLLGKSLHSHFGAKYRAAG